MASLLFNSILILLLLSSVNSQCNTKNSQRFFKRAIYEFTSKLSSRINLDTESHFVSSGLSTWTLIAALSLGASEETLKEIAHVLKMHPHPCFNDKYFQIAKSLTSITNGTLLERSATLFINDQVQPSDDFKTEVSDAGVCDIDVISLDDLYAAAAYINNYVNTATHEAIDEIVTPNDLDGALIVMIDALFFKGAWKISFPYSDTENSAFYNEKGNQIGDVNLMFTSGSFNTASISQIKAEILELPYGEEDRFSMLIILPLPNVSVSSVVENLNRISLRTIFSHFEFYGKETVAVQIPRFKITSDLNLKDLLIDMGLRKMFDRGEAQFYDFGPNVYVSNLVQKADIEVTEDGTVAGAVSEATLEGRMLPAQFTANRPFLFMIVDKTTEIPLFLGAYSKPNTY